MIDAEAWIGRTWSIRLAVGLFPNVLERVRGTPARAAGLVNGIADDVVSVRTGGRWSAKEHIAHLDDLHDLDETRLEEFTAGADVLSEADMTNARTESARHNETPMADILSRFRDHRMGFVARLETLSADAVDAACRHPRLGQELRLIDWVHFIAEHDDHHLVRARRAMRREE